MLPNNACELLLSYLLSSIKRPSYLAQNLSFCEVDVWDSVLLLNCPDREVFERILKSKKALANAISKQLPEIKLASLRWHNQVVDLKIDYLVGKQSQRPSVVFQLVFDIAELIKQSEKPVLVAKLDGQILFGYSPSSNENFLVENVYLSSAEASRMAEAVESYGWVNGYHLRLDNQHDSKGIFTTVRARYAKDTLLNELVLIVQVLNTESLGSVPSRDIA